MAAREDDPSRYLYELETRGAAIRVVRADMARVAQAREAHTRRVIRAWMESKAPGGATVQPHDRGPATVRARLRTALARWR
jgi:hypothetical protein